MAGSQRSAFGAAAAYFGDFLTDKPGHANASFRLMTKDAARVSQRLRLAPLANQRGHRTTGRESELVQDGGDVMVDGSDRHDEF